MKIFFGSLGFWLETGRKRTPLPPYSCGGVHSDRPETQMEWLKAITRLIKPKTPRERGLTLLAGVLVAVAFSRTFSGDGSGKPAPASLQQPIIINVNQLGMQNGPTTRP